MKPIPQAIYDRAELLSRSHRLQVVAELLGKNASTITRMRQRGWRAVDYSCMRRERPADFAIQAAHMPYAELVEHYRAGTATVTRWLHEIGRGRGRK
jgi:hypothetical protein